jgi:hypothetical protein
MARVVEDQRVSLSEVHCEPGEALKHVVASWTTEGVRVVISHEEDVLLFETESVEEHVFHAFSVVNTAIEFGSSAEVVDADDHSFAFVVASGWWHGGRY